MSTQATDSFYKSLLASLLMVVEPVENHNQLISLRTIGSPDKQPLEVDGKRLALASHAALANPQWDTLTYFHPLCESPIRGESPVLKGIMRWVLLRLTTVSQVLLAQLIDIAADKDYHAELSAKQHGVLDALANIDEKSNKAFEQLVNRMTLTGDNRFLSMYLKASGTWKDQSWARVCSVRFPFLEELESPTAEDVFGVKLRKKDRATFIEAMGYLLPKSNIEGAYSYGSNNLTAPQLHALLSAYGNVATALNKVTMLFKKHLEEYDDLLIDVSWMDSLDNLSQWREVYPPLPGNNGDVKVGDNEVSKAPPKFNASRLMNEVNVAPVAPVGNAESHQAEPVVVSAAAPVYVGGLEVKMNPLGNLPGPAPSAVLPVGAPSGIQRTANGVVFSSLLATAPATPQNGWGQQTFNGGFQQAPATYQQPVNNWQAPAPTRTGRL